jgi:spermidine synthase
MSSTRLGSDIWFTEYLTPYDGYTHGLTDIYLRKETAFQEMLVVRSGVYGKGLILDGHWQTCEGDEFMYHEPLVHIACRYHGAPKNVLILGGGDGGAAREALRWKSVEKVVMVDIDGEVVEACRQHLPEIHQGSFDDPRYELVVGDAYDFIAEQGPVWDAIIADMTDPIEHGPAFKLFTREFYELCAKALAPNACYVMQAGPTSPVEMDLHLRIVSTARAAFANLRHFAVHIPTYFASQGFILGSQSDIEFEPDPAETDRILEEMVEGDLRYVDGRTLIALMNPPKYLREAAAKETYVYSLAEPPKWVGEGIIREES